MKNPFKMCINCGKRSMSEKCYDCRRREAFPVSSEPKEKKPRVQKRPKTYAFHVAEPYHFYKPALGGRFK